MRNRETDIEMETKTKRGKFRSFWEVPTTIEDERGGNRNKKGNRNESGNKNEDLFRGTPSLVN